MLGTESFFFERPLAFTDVETSGTDPGWHEILELGVILVDPRQEKIIDQGNWKTIPVHLERMDPMAQARNGYTAEGWTGAVSLYQAMQAYAKLCSGAVLWAFNAAFDVGFLKAAFQETGIPNPLDYHYFDVMSLAYPRLRQSNQAKFSLDFVSTSLGLPPESMPHQAVNGAKQAFEVWKILMNKDKP